MKIKKSVALAAILMLSPFNSFAKDFKDVSKDLGHMSIYIN